MNSSELYHVTGFKPSIAHRIIAGQTYVRQASEHRRAMYVRCSTEMIRWKPCDRPPDLSTGSWQAGPLAITANWLSRSGTLDDCGR
jgi:hypothetical protein